MGTYIPLVLKPEHKRSKQAHSGGGGIAEETRIVLGLNDLSEAMITS